MSKNLSQVHAHVLKLQAAVDISHNVHLHARPRVFRESGRVLLMARIVLLCLRDERITVRCPLSEQPWDNVAPRAVVNQASFLNSHVVIREVYGRLDAFIFVTFAAIG